MSLIYSKSDDAFQSNTSSAFAPSDSNDLVCPKPPTLRTMDGCWKLSSASGGIENIADWLQRLCIRNGRVRDGTGSWKALKMVNGVPTLDGGELHLDMEGKLCRYGKKGDTFVKFSRDRAHCRAHSPKNSLVQRIKREVSL
jgi:hypothetical protein